MTTQELIGKHIIDIRCNVKEFDYEGTIPLHESECYIILDTEDVFQLPYGSGEIEVEKKYLDEKYSIFNTLKTTSRFRKFLTFFSLTENSNRQQDKYVQGQEIIGVYSLQNTDSDIYRCLLELKSGYLIAEKTIGIQGTGQAGIWFFNSKNHLKLNIDGELIRIH